MQHSGRTAPLLASPPAGGYLGPGRSNKGVRGGSREADGWLFAQHFGLDKLDTGPIVLSIKGAFFDTGDQTIIKYRVRCRS